MSSKIIPSLGQRIRNIRDRFSMSQAEFAKKLGITASYVSQLESGKKTEISQQLAKLIALEFKERIDWWLIRKMSRAERIEDGPDWVDKVLDRNATTIRLKLPINMIAQLESEAKRAHMPTNDYVLKLMNEGLKIRKILTDDDKEKNKSHPRNRKKRTVK